MLDTLARAQQAAAASAKPAPSAIPAVAPVPSAKPSAPAKAPGIELSAADVAKLSVALWKIRNEGKRIVRSGTEDDLPGVLPILLQGADLTPELAEMLDVNTEHAMFLLGMFALRFHPRSPVPVPQEILLYEAWMTHTDKIKLDGFGPAVNAVKSVVYSQNALCDLAAAEATSAEAQKGATEAAMSASLKRLSKGSASVDAQEAALINASVRAVAHGAAGACYLQRDERDKAVEELGKFLEAAQDLGAPPSETAIVRAYVAYEKGDHDEARKCLELARDYPGTDAETRAQIEELLKHVAKNDDGAIRKFYGKAYFSVFAARLIYTRLDRAGVFEELKNTELVRKISGYGGAVTEVIEGAKKSVPSLGDAKEMGTGLWDRITH